MNQFTRLEINTSQLEFCDDGFSVTYLATYGSQVLKFKTSYECCSDISNRASDRLEGITGALLYHCIGTKSPLFVSGGGLDIGFLNNTRKLKRVFSDIADIDGSLETHAKHAQRRKPSEKLSLACFTGGLDAFYTLAVQKDNIDALLYTVGFDVDLEQGKLIADIRQMLTEVSCYYNIPVVIATLKRSKSTP